jgi:hypothetical protein
MIEFRPKFVLMYQKSKEEAWLRIAAGAVEIEEAESPFAKFWSGARIWKLGPTILATAWHPTAPYSKKPGPSNEDWIELGRVLSKASAALS